jgi:hypothetical protein
MEIQIFHYSKNIIFKKKIIFFHKKKIVIWEKKFSISKNNIICAKAAKVGTTGILKIRVWVVLRF